MGAKVLFSDEAVWRGLNCPDELRLSLRTFVLSRARSFFEPLTKFVACAAFLACSLFGKSLHDLHHVLEDSTQEKSSSGCCHSHRLCHGDREHRHGSDDQNPDDQSSTRHDQSGGHRHLEQAPGHSHDSHNCAICYALSISATAPESVAVSTDQTPVSWQFFIVKETIAECCRYSDEARGPPSLA